MRMQVSFLKFTERFVQTQTNWVQVTNVVQFFELLKKDDQSKQMVYYQTGIGTYAHPLIFTPILTKLATVRLFQPPNLRINYWLTSPDSWWRRRLES